MPRRNLSDHEISLIKAMLDRGHRNQDIQFRFNRPDRPVNSGRISGIRSGSYGNAAAIPAASASELDAFLAGARSASTMQSVTPAITEPVDEVAGLFAQGAE